MTMLVDWYFDFISPFAYLQLRRMLAPPAGVEVRFKPVLFAAILDHVGQLGPAEIPSKRAFTYRQVVWRARREGTPLRFPPAHPFNSLRMLRLAVAAGSTARSVQAIFDYAWRDGHLPDDEPAWQAFLSETDLGAANARTGDVEVKRQLRANTDAAIAAGVFGVPSCVVDGEIFWGSDVTDMVLEYCRDPSLLDDPEMRRVGTLPVGATRPRSPAPTGRP
jgi:2-hydroxychromene-2-carboxylate isomerase